MEHKDIYDLLKNINVPVAYGQFDTSLNVSPPFIVYREIRPENFKADNKVYFKQNAFEIELVTIKKDVILQKSIEDLLTNNNIPYEMTDELWDKEEKIYHNFYEI